MGGKMATVRARPSITAGMPIRDFLLQKTQITR